MRQTAYASGQSTALYIDTVVEPWPGFYFDPKLGPEARSNYALRESVLAARRKKPGGPTAVSCCGANPGMVSWFVKQALLNVAKDIGLKFKDPTDIAKVIDDRFNQKFSAELSQTRGPAPDEVTARAAGAPGSHRAPAVRTRCQSTGVPKSAHHRPKQRKRPRHASSASSLRVASAAGPMRSRMASLTPPRASRSWSVS